MDVGKFSEVDVVKFTSAQSVFNLLMYLPLLT